MSNKFIRCQIRDWDCSRDGYGVGAAATVAGAAQSGAQGLPLSGLEVRDMGMKGSMEGDLTVVLCTSAVPSHPSTDLIMDTALSLRFATGLDAGGKHPLLILCDGARVHTRDNPRKGQVWLSTTACPNLHPSSCSARLVLTRRRSSASARRPT